MVAENGLLWNTKCFFTTPPNAQPFARFRATDDFRRGAPMIARNPPQRHDSHVQALVPPGNRLAQRLARYFALHPHVSREEFLVTALEKELDYRAADLGWKPLAPGHPGDRPSHRWVEERRPLTEEDLRIHAWLMERLALLHHERHGWWPKLRRFLGL
jgi:hypothetical protein